MATTKKKVAKKAIKKAAPAKKVAAKKAAPAKKATPVKNAAVKKSAPAKKVAPAKKAVAKKAAPAKKAAAAKAPVPMQAPTMVNAYLTFNGNCEQAFNFYKSVFGGEFAFIGRFKDMPPMGDKPMPASEGEKIMHVSLPISKETLLLGSDSSDAFGHATVVGTNFSMSVSTGSKDAADKLFKGLSAGGKVTMPISNTFWGSYFGMLTDKFDIQWMVSYDQPQNK